MNDYDDDGFFFFNFSNTAFFNVPPRRRRIVIIILSRRMHRVYYGRVCGRISVSSSPPPPVHEQLSDRAENRWRNWGRGRAKESLPPSQNRNRSFYVHFFNIVLSFEFIMFSKYFTLDLLIKKLCSRSVSIVTTTRNYCQNATVLGNIGIVNFGLVQVFYFFFFHTPTG